MIAPLVQRSHGRLQPGLSNPLRAGAALILPHPIYTLPALICHISSRGQ